MNQFRSYKFRIYPTIEQEEYLRKGFGSKRFIYNKFLSELNARYEDRKSNGPSESNKFLSAFDISNNITVLKKDPEFVWLREIDDWILKNSAVDLSNAFKNFFSSISGKRKGEKLKQPAFKNKDSRQSFRTFDLKIRSDGIKIPKLKSVIKTEFHRSLPSNIDLKKGMHATISRTPSGKYFVSILVEEDIPLQKHIGREVGIDLGLTNLAILSDGVKFNRVSNLLEKANQKLKCEQKKLSRMKKVSANRKLQRRKVAECFDSITRIKHNYYHNVSRFLVNNYDSIYMETLSVKNMMKNRKLSRVLHEASLSTLVGMIEYKSNWAGRSFHKIDRWFPSSKTCSCCGHKVDSLSLDIREWNCPSCGTHHDRDINAAKNIKNRGQLDCYEKLIPDATSGRVCYPLALKKMIVKIERTDLGQMIMGPEQAQLLNAVG